MISWLQFLLWFCFELPQAGHKPNPTPFNEGHIWEVLAFGNVAAIGFVVSFYWTLSRTISDVMVRAVQQKI